MRLENYYNSLFIFEESENERFRNKKPEILKMLLRSYARATSTESSIQTLIKDVRQSNERTMDEKTMSDYLSALKYLFIIEDMEAWNPNIRSKTSIRSTPTRHFVDASIACRALQLGPMDLINDLNKLDNINIFRLSFTLEDYETTKKIIKAFKDKLNGIETSFTFDKDTDTRGHFNKEIL